MNIATPRSVRPSGWRLPEHGMDVVLVELSRVDPKRYGAVLDDAECGLRAFAHHVAPRQDELAAARYARRLDEQDVAADRGPGEPGAPHR